VSANSLNRYIRQVFPHTKLILVDKKTKLDTVVLIMFFTALGAFATVATAIISYFQAHDEFISITYTFRANPLQVAARARYIGA
jgi:hypothetical protein